MCREPKTWRWMARKSTVVNAAQMFPSPHITFTSEVRYLI